MNEEIITTAPAEEDGTNEIFTKLIEMVKDILKVILPLVGLGYFVKYL